MGERAALPAHPPRVEVTPTVGRELGGVLPRRSFGVGAGQPWDAGWFPFMVTMERTAGKAGMHICVRAILLPP